MNVGRTPLKLSLRPGQTRTYTFRRAGHVPVVRKITTPENGGPVTITLRTSPRPTKAPPKSKKVNPALRDLRDPFAGGRSK